jgi:hypothetical protein
MFPAFHKPPARGFFTRIRAGLVIPFARDAMEKLSPRDEWDWLNGNPRLDALMKRRPEIWEDAGQELVAALEDGRAEKLNELATKAKAAADLWHDRIRRSRKNSKVIEAALPALIKSRMSLLALDRCYLAAATGKSSGRIRFNRVNGAIIQRLFFSHHLTRKPVSLGWFRFWWPLVGQKRLLMPLVQPRGIYCFYSHRLIAEIAAVLGSRSCLEIAAGDGTLSRFLADAGLAITATDDYSWNHAIAYPESVVRLDAKQALDRYQPQAVICSWPPPANNFEKWIFSSKSVEIYIVIGSRYSFASGNWKAYSAQTRFEMSCDARLSSYVLPPELDSQVILFRRKP